VDVSNLPEYIGRFNVKKFTEFLDAGGVEILTPTNDWEVLRVYFNQQVGIVYKNAAGKLNCCIDKIRNGVNKSSPKFQAIIDRDGYECFYCGGSLTPATESVEHMLSKAHGGSNHIKNLVLAHRKCNSDAGHLSISEKVKLRDKCRAQKEIKS
jgi:hypothetical protein